MTDSVKAVTIMLKASHRLEDVLRKDIETYGMNTTEFGVLELLYHKGKQPMQVICGKLLMANSSMTYVVDKLYKKELVTRVNDPSDRRMVYIELTKEGLAFIESIFPNHQKRIEEVFSILDVEELQTLTTLLKKVGYHSEALLKESLKEEK